MIKLVAASTEMIALGREVGGGGDHSALGLTEGQLRGGGGCLGVFGPRGQFAESGGGGASSSEIIVAVCHHDVDVDV